MDDRLGGWGREGGGGPRHRFFVKLRSIHELLTFAEDWALLRVNTVCCGLLIACCWLWVVGFELRCLSSRLAYRKYHGLSKFLSSKDRMRREQ